MQGVWQIAVAHRIKFVINVILSCNFFRIKNVLNLIIATPVVFYFEINI